MVSGTSAEDPGLQHHFTIDSPARISPVGPLAIHLQIYETRTKIPVVLCFDQIEALLVDPNDRTPFAVLGQVIMKLFNGTSNLLLISCVQSTFVDHLNLDQPGSVSTPAAARMAVQQKSLGPLQWDHATRLIQARMLGDSRLASLRESRAQ